MHNVSTTVINATKRITTVHSVFTDCCKYIQPNEVKLTSSCFCTSMCTRTRAHTHTHTQKAIKVTEFEDIFTNRFVISVTLSQAWVGARPSGVQTDSFSYHKHEGSMTHQQICRPAP